MARARQGRLVALGLLALCGACALLGRGRPPTAEQLEARWQQERRRQEQIARSIPSGAPSLWYSPLDAATMESALMLPDGRILVATGALDPDSANPRHGPYVLVDGTTGEVLWEHARSPELAVHYSLVTAGERIVIRCSGPDGTRLSALDPGSGREQWRLEIEEHTQIRLLPDGRTLLLSTPASGPAELFAISGRDGRELWRIASDVSAGEVPRIEVLSDAFWVAGPAVAIHEPRGGKEIARVDALGPLARESHPVELPDGTLVGARGGRLAFLGRDDTVRWRATLPGEPGILAYDAERVFAAYASGVARGVAAFARVSGELLWRRELDGIHSALTPFDGRLALTTAGELVLLDAKTGSRLASAALARTGPRLPDRLLAMEGQLVLIRESGVAAYPWSGSAAGWQPLWDHEIAGADPTLESVVATLRDAGFPAEAIAALVEPLESPKTLSQRQHAFVALAARGAQAGARSQPAPGRSPTGLDLGRLDPQSRAELQRRFASGLDSTGAQQQLLELQLAWERAQAASNMLGSGIDAAVDMKQSADRGFGEALRKNVDRKWIAIAPYRLSAALEAHRNGLFGPWFVRAFRRPGNVAQGVGPRHWGFTVVDLRDGRWREVTSWPDGEALSALTLSLQPVLLAPDGRRIVTRAVGLEPERWRRGLGLGGVHSASPAATLVAYAVAGAWQPAERYAGRRTALFGQQLDVEQLLAWTQAASISFDELQSEFGPPFSRTTMGGSSAAWQRVVDVGGELEVEGVSCELDPGDVVRSCVRTCYPPGGC